MGNKKSNNININDVVSQITKELENYSKRLGEQMYFIAEEETKNAVAELKKISPKKIGKYAKGWRTNKTLKINGKGRYFNNIINNKEYRLTHLLEYGHVTRKGGFVKGKKHIEPIELKYKKRYENKVKEAIKGLD